MQSTRRHNRARAYAISEICAFVSQGFPSESICTSEVGPANGPDWNVGRYRPFVTEKINIRFTYILPGIVSNKSTFALLIFGMLHAVICRFENRDLFYGAVLAMKSDEDQHGTIW